MDLTAEDFSLDLDENLVALETVDVFGATMSSVTPIDLEVAMESIFLPPSTFIEEPVDVVTDETVPVAITADIAGQFPDGSAFPAVGDPSLDPDGDERTPTQANSAPEFTVTISGNNEVEVVMFGLVVGYFPQLANPDVDAPPVRVTATLTFLGEAVTPIPEPSSAMLFGFGLAVVYQRVGRRPRDGGSSIALDHHRPAS